MRLQTVTAIVAKVAPSQQQLFVDWLGTFGRHARVLFRTMALDVAAALLTSPAADARLSPLMVLVTSRVHDKMPRCVAAPRARTQRRRATPV